MYYQDMIGLEQSHPDIYHHFMNGHHIVRRSDRQWAGLSCDLVIESCLMRNLKTSGGLTHESDMSEAQRSLWTLSMPACAQVHNAMQQLTGLIRPTGEQQEDLGSSCKA